jgi:hypothetical protein
MSEVPARADILCPTDLSRCGAKWRHHAHDQDFQIGHKELLLGHILADQVPQARRGVNLSY